MTIARVEPASQGGAPASDSENRYESGLCNIGPEEIAYRQHWGHLGVLVTVLMLAFLLWIHAPLAARLLIVFPAWGTAVAYLQAWLHFCAAFGALGIFNFERLGAKQRVADPEARARDRRRAVEIVLTGLLAGIICGAVAVLLPV
jgi:hypothetical protein